MGGQPWVGSTETQGAAGGMLASVREFSSLCLAATPPEFFNKPATPSQRERQVDTEGQGKADKNEAEPQCQNKCGFCLEGSGR